MLVKVAELIGPALDWAVAKCEGQALLDPNNNEWEYCWNLLGDNSGDYYSPSTNWEQGGPILEKEGMQVFNCSKSSPEEPWFVEKNHFGRHHKAGRSYAQGPTILIAAMRCYCCAKLGEEIDIPQKLQPCQQPNL